MSDRLITLAIHTYDKAVEVRRLLEAEGIEVTLQNVNLEHPETSPGIRLRIREADLSRALRVVENPDIFDREGTDEADAKGASRILIPVDFSPHSLGATTIGFAMAHSLRQGVDLLHTYIDPYSDGSMQLSASLSFDRLKKSETPAGPERAQWTSRSAVRQSAQWDMSNFASHLRQMMKLGTVSPVRFASHVAEGVPEDAINDWVKAHRTPLVVMGTRGAGRKQRELIGSVTAEVLDQGRAAVLAIPENVATSPADIFSRIVFFVNLDQSDILALDTLYRLSGNAQAHVCLLGVADRKRLTLPGRSSANAERLMQYCRTNFPRFTFTCENIAADHLDRSLGQREQNEGISLIVIPDRKKRSAITRLFSPTLARRIIFRADIPVLNIPV